MQGDSGGWFTYPPFAALLFAPFAEVPVRLADAVWTVAVVGCAVWFLSRSVPRAGPGATLPADRARPGLPALILCATLAPLTSVLFNAVRFGQIGTVLTALVVADLVLLRRGHRWTGVLTGLAAAVKLVPGFFVLWFVVLGRRREALVATASFAVWTLGAAIVMPGDSVRFWTDALWHTERVGPSASVRNQSLAGLLERSGAPDLLTAPAVVLVAVAGLLAARRWARQRDVVVAGCLVGCVAVLVSPIAWTHHHTWLLIVLVVVLVRPATGTRVGDRTPVWSSVLPPWVVPVAALTDLALLTGALDPLVPAWIERNVLVGSTFAVVMTAVSWAAADAWRRPPEGRQAAVARPRHHRDLPGRIVPAIW